MRHLLIPFALFVSLSSAAFAQRRPGASTTAAPAGVNQECLIIGQVAMPDATPNQGIEVVLETADHARSQSTFTDGDGRFQFGHLSPATYYLYVNLEGFSEQEQQVTIQQTGSPTITVSVSLAMTRGPSETSMPATARAGDRPTDESLPGTIAADIVSKYPQKVVKEYQQGLDEQSKGHADKAAGHFEKATAGAAQFYEAWLELGKARQSLGQLDPADQAYQHARTLRPKSAEPLIQLGGLALDRARKLETQGNDTEAMTTYRNSLSMLDGALKLDPASRQIAYFRGSAQYKIGDLAGAELSLKTAINEPRPFEEARLMFVNVLMKQRRYKEALDQLAAYLQANPNSPQRRAVEKMEAQIRSVPQRKREKGTHT